ncbi:MAG: diadenylate cyclase CdaA [Clostridia bacterium]|nr:diadenylate cyclase CdaA [Clostridia bacterium]
MVSSFQQVIGAFKFIRIQDYIDILIVAYVIYKGIKMIRDTRAIQLIKGIIMLLVALQLSSWFGLHMINYILLNTVQVGVIAIIIVFQPELRNALEKIGRSRFSSLFTGVDENAPERIETTAKSICDAAESMSNNNVGALIVCERETKIGDIIRTGVTIDSAVSAELLVNIFIPNTPLHDGAVVIRQNRIVAASCFLPLTQNDELSIDLGTRHRAALGISEASDAVVVVVSEETGKISLALDGSLTRNLTYASLQKALVKVLMADSAKEKRNGLKFWKGLKK